MHYTDTYSPTPVTAAIRMLLTTAVAKDRELRHFSMEQAFLKAGIDKGIKAEIPEEYREISGPVGLLNTAMYGLVVAEMCRDIRLCNNMRAIGFEQ